MCAPLGLKSSEISYQCSLFKCPWCCRAANTHHPGSSCQSSLARPSRGACRQRYRDWLDKACILSVKRFHFKLNSPVVLKTLHFVWIGALFSFSPLNTAAIVDCFPSNFWQKDQWTNLDKAILAPFLVSTENNFKAMQTRELFHMPSLALRWKMEFQNRGEIQNFANLY